MNKKTTFIVLIIILVVLAAGFWLGLFYKAPQKKGLSDQGDQFFNEIKKRGKIIIGTTGVFDPMSFKDEKGDLVGHDIEIAKEIASGLGVKVEFKVGDFTNLLKDVEDDKIDALINAVTITNERSKIYSFSDPYFSNGQAILVRKENVDIKSETDLAGKKVGAWKNTTCEIEAKKYIGDGEVISYDYHEDVEALKRGEVDAVVIDQINAFMTAESEPTLKTVGKMFSEEYYGVVMNKNAYSLVSEVNKIIKELKRSGKLDEFKKEWIISRSGR